MKKFRMRRARFYTVLAFMLVLISGSLICPYLKNLKTPAGEKRISRLSNASSKQARQELVELIPEGMRGFTITLEEQRSTKTRLKTGNYVDVVIIFEGDNSQIYRTSTTIRQRRIISTDEAGNIVLLVTPEEAERLAFALAYGKIALTLCPNKEER